MITAILTALFTMQVKAKVVNVTMCPDIITFETPDGNLFDEFGYGLKIGQEVTAEYNPATKQFSIDW